MKGALVMLTSTFGASVPKVIAFQFNPETLQHSWTQPESSGSGKNPLAVQGMPGEAFSFSLAMDVTDQLALGVGQQFQDAQLNGISSRLAALEILMFPVEVGPTGQKRAVPAEQLPTVLFVWGGGRIVPVRITSLTITEKLFDQNLNPTHADAQIELRVLTPTDLAFVPEPLGQLANIAYSYSKTKREGLAHFNFDTNAGLIALPTFLGH